MASNGDPAGETRGPLPLKLVLAATSVMIIAGLAALTGSGQSNNDRKAGNVGTRSTTSMTKAKATTTTAGATTTTAVVHFGTIGVNAIPAGQGGKGTVSECALLAETDEQRARGLMGRKDLGGYVGMVFRWPNDVTASFFMKNVDIPLSLAWFDENGFLIGAVDMEPCEVKDCPLYAPPEPFRFALEVPKGGLENLKMGPGGQVQLGQPCTPG